MSCQHSFTEASECVSAVPSTPDPCSWSPERVLQHGSCWLWPLVYKGYINTHRILLFALFHMTKAVQRKIWVSYANVWVNSTRLDSLGVPHSCKYWFIMFTVEFNICLSVWCPGSAMKQRWPNDPIRSIRVSGNKRWIDLNQSPANISSVGIIILLIFTKSNWIFLLFAVPKICSIILPDILLPQHSKFCGGYKEPHLLFKVL